MTKYFFEKIQKIFLEENVRISNVGYSRDKGVGFVNAWKVSPIEKQAKARIIFAHATGNDALFPQISLFLKLAKHQFEIFSFDLDGHGESSTTTFTEENFFSCINQAIEEFSSKDSDIPIFLIGQSLGGTLILNYLSRTTRNSDIQGAVIVSTPLKIKFSSINSFQELIGFLHSSFFNQFKYYGYLGSLPALGYFKRKRFPIRLSNQYHQLDYRNLIAQIISGAQIDEKSSKIKTSTLLIYGNLDTIASVEDGEILQQKLENSELYIEPEETHFTTLLTQTVEDKITRWLEEKL